MSDTIFAATRKGLFTITRKATGWRIDNVSFLGDPVSQLLHDRRDGTLYACLDLGHFGAKLRRSDDGGSTWDEVATPSYPSDAGTPAQSTGSSATTAASTSGRRQSSSAG